MKTSENGFNLIKTAEGFSATPIPDSGGKSQIGYGHDIKHGEFFTSITEEQAEEILATDVTFAESAINQAVCVELNQNQFDALVDFTYNLGGKALLNSTLLKLLNNGDYNGAAAQFSRWVYAGDCKMPGLISRRKAEHDLFLTPISV